MRRPTRRLLLALLTFPATLLAQAPRITPDGDPSVAPDSIYRLASESARYADQPFVYLLDDGVIRLDADGRGTRTYRQIVHILQQEGIDTWAEQRFGWEPKHQKLTVNWIRVLGPDGKVVADRPGLCQESDVPARTDVPVFVERKVMRCSLHQVAVGSIIDYSVTTEELAPSRPGDFALDWRITPGRPTRRSRYVVDLPASLKPAIVEDNLPEPARVRTASGRTVRTWVARDLAPIEPEPLAADSNGVIAHVSLTSGTPWASIGTWYAGLAAGRDAATPEVRAKLTELTRGAKTRRDSLAAVHRWVAQDIRYVSIALGEGGYQPRPAAEVLASGTGDCKDKATLFIAMARAMGVNAWPVLLNGGGKVDPRLPSIEQFNHAIAAVELGGATLYTDLTADIVPFGEIPGNDQGQFAVLVRSATRADTVRLPLNAPEQNTTYVSLVGTLDEAGRVDVRYEQTAVGGSGIDMRSNLSATLDSADVAEAGRGIATSYFPSARAEDIVIANGRDLAAKPLLAMRMRDGQAARKLDDRLMLLTLPYKAAGAMKDAAAALEAKGPRRFPIDAEAFLGAVSIVQTLRLTLPEGWAAKLPPPVDVRGEWGDYRVRYAQEGRDLVLERVMTGRRGVHPPESVRSLIEWMRAVSADETEQIVLDTRGGTS